MVRDTSWHVAADCAVPAHADPSALPGWLGEGSPDQLLALVLPPGLQVRLLGEIWL